MVFNWFELYLRDYLNNDDDIRKEETKDLFADYANFEYGLKTIFGDPDEIRNAKRQLNRIR